jgi:hypothetical protein
MFPADLEYAESNKAQQVHQYPDLQEQMFMDRHSTSYIRCMFLR